MQRKTIELLPEFLQSSDQLRKFFNATIDHWFQQENSRKIAGFVGRVPSYFNSTTDFYLAEPTEERQKYQLEPGMVSYDTTGAIQDVLAYPDLVKMLAYQGALTNNHDRLFKQEYYSWAPPIDIDKYINFNNYFWYPEGPTEIEIFGNSSNFIGVELDILGQLNYTSPNAITFTNGMKIKFVGAFVDLAYVNKTYIVEGVGTGILLVDWDLLNDNLYPLEYSTQEKEYIVMERGSLDQNPWTRSNHWYHRDVLIFSNIVTGDNFLESQEDVLWDDDPWDMAPWDSVVTVLTPDFLISTDRQARRPIIEFDRGLELYNYGNLSVRTADIVDTTTTDVFSNIQGQLVGSVLINGTGLADGMTILVTADTNPGVNNRLYLITELEVSPSVFEYQLTLITTGINNDGSPVLKEKILTLDGDNAGKEYYYNGTNYVLAQRKVDRNQEPLFNLYDTDANYLGDTSVYFDNDFFGNKIFNYQRNLDLSGILDEELGFRINYQNFNQTSEIIQENYLETSLYSYADANFKRFPITGYYFYYNTMSELYGNEWNLAENPSQQLITDDFYNIPTNLEANPLYDEIETTTRSQLLAHFGSIISNQPGVAGKIFSDTNYKDLIKDRSLGTKILQHNAPLLKLMLLCRKESISYIDAVRYVSKEYKRFRNKFLGSAQKMVNQGFSTPYRDRVYDILNLLNTAKIGSTIFPFKYSTLIPATQDSVVAVYEADSGDTEFVLPNDLTEESGLVYVYQNGDLLLDQYDYDIAGDTITLTTPAAANDEIEIYVNVILTGSYIPATAATLGILDVYKPERYTDSTYTTPVDVLRCHDGSIHIEYGDERDLILFELEKMIYNGIASKFKKDREIFFNKHEVLPGKFRDNDYTYDEYREILTPIFTRWATKAGINWSENVTYDAGNWKTWNWSRSTDAQTNENLQGSWRAIYNYYYDTDSPHERPWEMLGFSEKPEWWETYYGAAPYRANNTELWADLELGLVREGTRAGVNDLYVRTGLVDIIPVDNAGRLLSPSEIGITPDEPGIESAQEDWRPGDLGPVETAFWRSSEYSFILSQICYLMRPAKFIELNWEPLKNDHAEADATQLINTDFKYRPSPSELTVSGEDGVAKTGVQDWISNYLQSTHKDVTENFGDDIRGLDVSLVWKNAGYIKKNGLRFMADSYSPASTSNAQKVFIQDDDINVLLYKSPNFRTTFYGGAIVEWTGTGYAIYGYDVNDPYFKIIPSDTGNKKVVITVADISVNEYKFGIEDTLIEIPYGYEFVTREEVYDFLISYGRYLDSEGWLFDEYDQTSNELKNWRYAGKQFLFWSQDILDEHAFITLSPSAELVKFNSNQGFVENIEEIIEGSYSILDREGQAIEPKDIESVREDSLIQIYPLNEQGIYSVRLRVQEYESVVVLPNVSRFNDLIYLPLYSLRQQRLKAIGHISEGWNGRIYAPGFIIDFANNDLIPNFEKTAHDFRRYHSIENPSENDAITDVARQTIGYQRRKYLDELLINRDSQYQFYQGFIRQKGSPNSFQRLFRSTAITTASDVDFFEEWAIRTGMYGGTEIKPPLEARLLPEDIKSDPQIIRFVSGKKPDRRNDSIIELTANDSRWIAKSEENEEQFTLREKNTYYKKDLPNAGYVKFGETDYIIPTLNKLWDSTEAVFNIVNGETIWVAIDYNNILNRTNGWDVLRAEQSALYAFTDASDNNILRTFAKQSYTGDGVTYAFIILNNDYDLSDEDSVLVYVDNVLIEEWSISGSELTLEEIPELNSVIDVYTYANHELEANDVVSFYDDLNRENGVIESVDGFIITMDTQYTNFNADFESANLIKFESRRYPTPDIINTLSPSEFKNQFFYFDQDVDSEGWVVYKSNGQEFKIYREENELIDADLITNALIYNDRDNRIKQKLTIIDPFKGLIPGLANTEITYKLEFDPAKYNRGPALETTNQLWGDRQIGQVWWDLSTIRFVWYEMEDLEYRLQHWGQIFPGTTVNVYEWVRSPVLPEAWADYVETKKSQFDYSTGGTVKDIDTDEGPSYVQVDELDKNGTVKSFYYFWVENKESTPGLDFRSIPITDVVSIITNPSDYGVIWGAALREDAFIFANVSSTINNNDNILQINFKIVDSDVPIHYQWELIRENEDLSVIKDQHWNKLRDSLVGFDDLGKNVPDDRLRGNLKYGHFYRPRQTWFKNRGAAREVFIEATNTILKTYDIENLTLDLSKLSLAEEISVTETIIDGTEANPTVATGDQISINGIVVIFSGLNGFVGIADEINVILNDYEIYAEIFYDGVDAYLRLINRLGQNINLVNAVGNPVEEMGFLSQNYLGTGPNFIVDTKADRATLTINIGDTVLVEHDEDYRNYWTYWRFLGANNWKLLKIQSFNTSEYWDYIDWYDEGYSSDTVIDVSFYELTDRNQETNNLEVGTIAKVVNDGSNKWILSVLQDNLTWKTIGREDGTIEFSSILYNVDETDYGFDTSLFDTSLFDEYPEQEMRNILDALRDDIFIGALRVHLNQLFFKMIHYVHSEQEMVDWIFKTSYLYMVGFTDNLSQKPIFTNDGFEELIEFVQEAKPYRSKLKDIIRTYATTLDETNVSVIDYDRQPYDDGEEVRILDQDSPSDLVVLSSEPWVNWLNEFERDDRPTLLRANNVRKIKTIIKYDRVSSIRSDWVAAIRFEDHPDYPDFYAPSPFFNPDEYNSTSARDNPTWYLLKDFVSSMTPANNLAIIRYRPVNDIITVVATGYFTNVSFVTIEASASPDFSDPIELLEITDEGSFEINYLEIKDTPFLRANYDNFEVGEIITVAITTSYDSALPRVLNYYRPNVGLPQTLEVIRTHYLGTIIDGFKINLGAGWDSSEWDLAPWDSNIDLDEFFDTIIGGGAFYTYEGDNSTGTYALPLEEQGVAPYSVYASDLSLDPLVPVELEETTHYTIDISTNEISLVTGHAWMNGSNLDTGWAISILDTTYDSEEAYLRIIDGAELTQPHNEGWPQELVPLKMNDSTIVTVVTSGGLDFNLLNGVFTETAGAPITFAGETPILFTISGVSGDTVVLEGSNTGDFDGEEEVIETFTTNDTIIVPTPTSGYASYIFYRAVVTVYGAGIISVNAEINYAPKLSYHRFNYDTATGTGPYDLSNIIETDDLLLTRNGLLLDSAADYTIASDQVTFAAPLNNGDLIEARVWDTTNVVNTNPTWYTDTYAALMDLENFGGAGQDVMPSPTQPLENSIFVFADTGTGFRRLAPPEASYYISDGEQLEFIILDNQFNLTTADITVWVDNILQTGGGGDYTHTKGGYFHPEIEITDPATGYVVGDVLTVSGGTGTAVTLEVMQVGGSGEIELVKVVNTGLYTVVPTNPVSVTGGAGASANFNLINYSLKEDTIVFDVAPLENTVVSMKILGNEDYEIVGTDLDIRVSMTGADTVGVMAFKDSDQAIGIQTRVFDGNDTPAEGVYLYSIDNRPINNTYTFVTENVVGDPVGGEVIAEDRYTTVNGAGWDAEAWDNGIGGFDQHNGGSLKLKDSKATTSKVVVTTLSGSPKFDTLTYREFIGYDDHPQNLIREIIRFSDAYKTFVTTNVQPDANIIYVDDASIFAATNGVAWVNEERVEYLQRTGGASPGASGALTGLVRGSKGTRKNLIHNVNDEIRPGDDSQKIVNGPFRQINIPGLRLPASDNSTSVFLQEEPGGYKSFT